MATISMIGLTQKMQTAAVEGPTKAQARKMAAYRHDLLARSAKGPRSRERRPSLHPGLRRPRHRVRPPPLRVHLDGKCIR